MINLLRLLVIFLTDIRMYISSTGSTWFPVLSGAMRIIDMFKTNMELNYNFEYNPNKSFKEQGVNEKAIEILSLINEKYIK